MTRTNAEINRALRIVETAWRANPELRLGQLVHVAASKAADRQPAKIDPFYAEDGDVLVGMRKLTADPRPRRDG